MQEHRSIEELENDYWKEASFPSHLVEKCFKYRKVPVSELSVEQLRLLIGQQIGLPYIVPKTIAVLQSDILAEGDYYLGDLLNSLLVLSEEVWGLWPDEKFKFVELLRENVAKIEGTGNRELIKNANAFLF